MLTSLVWSLIAVTVGFVVHDFNCKVCCCCVTFRICRCHGNWITSDLRRHTISYLWHIETSPAGKPLYLLAWPLLSSEASIVIESIAVLTSLVWSFDSCHRRFCCIYNFNREARCRCVTLGICCCHDNWVTSDFRWCTTNRICLTIKTYAFWESTYFVRYSLATIICCFNLNCSIDVFTSLL